MDPQDKQALKQCLSCKRPASPEEGGVRGQLYKGNGKNGMMVKFFLCNDCASQLPDPSDG
ncbi:MAG TPA: hypothetical protein VIG99_28775 [Myxococcaceae bacterium]